MSRNVNRVSSSSCSDIESPDEYQPRRVRSRTRGSRNRNSTSPDASTKKHHIRDRLDERSQSGHGVHDDQALFNYIMGKFNALQIEILRHSIQLRALTADVERLSSTKSVPVHQVRSRGRCYRCGQRGHHRLQCMNPRRPRQRTALLEAGSFQDDERRHTTSEDDMSWTSVIGGPADYKSRKAAYESDHLPTSQEFSHATNRILSRENSRGVQENRTIRSTMYNRTMAGDAMCSNVRGRQTDSAAKSALGHTDKVLIGHKDPLPTARTLDRLTTDDRTTKSVRRHRSERSFVGPIENDKQKTARRDRESAVMNQQGCLLIGGPADNSTGICGSSNPPRRRR